MRVFVSEHLRANASEQALNALITAFKWWKASEDREYESPFIGKDSALVTPKVDGCEYVLRHCHLLPNDPAQRRAWTQAYRRRKRKTSDRVLIYAQQGYDYYLIDVLEDPGAHEIMRMKDPLGRLLMNKCAHEAHLFLSRQIDLAPV